MEFIDTINVKGQEYQFLASYDSDGNHIVSTYVRQTYVDEAIKDAITDLIDSAPDALNTLKEISASLNDDTDFAGTMTVELSKKANVEDVHSKTEMESITGDIYKSITENFNILNTTLSKKAFTDDVYNKDKVYTKDEVNAIADNKADKEDSYTKDQLYTITEVDAAFSALRDELPTKVSELDNDAAYLVWSQVEHFAEAEAMITALAGKVDVEEGNVLIPLASAEKIASLPTRQEYNDRMTALDTAILNMTGDINTEAQRNDKQDGLILSNTDAITALQTSKVDAVEGMGLSSNDYTNEDKELLQDLSGRVDSLELATAILEQFEALVVKVGELEGKIAELEAKHSENSEEPSDPEAEPEA